MASIAATCVSSPVCNAVNDLIYNNSMLKSECLMLLRLASPCENHLKLQANTNTSDFPHPILSSFILIPLVSAPSSTILRPHRTCKCRQDNNGQNRGQATKRTEFENRLNIYSCDQIAENLAVPVHVALPWPKTEQSGEL